MEKRQLFLYLWIFSCITQSTQNQDQEPAGFIPGGEEATCVSDVCVSCNPSYKKDC